LPVTYPETMPREAPLFFKEVAARSAKRWDQLEADPELAAPWHQLFRQVQSPRHVLSELLQNAEDVGATWARCALTDDLFTFEHNGTDFDAASLGSMCRFGYSSKRTLHTIGFRGIGFKTTFSLGPIVTVETPTLAFRFNRRRYTMPLWVDSAGPIAHTRFSVSVEDENRRTALEDNLQDWLRSPVPILFFTNIQSLEINGTCVTKSEIGPGPVLNSRWLLLEAEHSMRLLKISAEPEELPREAVEEIRQERGDGEFEPGACSLDLIYGLSENRLYTVLPTQVMPNLPFSCNAPFVQEPSRVRIQDPAQSPTNRWLLERAGRLASQSLQAWVQNGNLAVGSRVGGYGLLPTKESSPLTPLDLAVRRIICQQIETVLQLAPCLISQSEKLCLGEECANIPADFVEAWGAETALGILGSGKERCVHPRISEATRKRLAGWGLLEARDDEALRSVLKAAETLPRPKSDDDLVQLWSAIEELNAGVPNWYSREAFTYPVIPAVGSELLFRPRDICRAIGQDENLDREDHDFLSGLVKIADGNALQRLEVQSAGQGLTEGESDKKVLERLQRAIGLFRRFTLEAWFLQRVFDTACRTAFSAEFTREIGFRLTKIAVKANLSAQEGYLAFLCRDEYWRFGKNGLIFSLGLYDDLLPDAWLQEHAISASYWDAFPEEEHQRLNGWLRSNKSGLSEFPSPQRIDSELSTPTKVRAEVSRRGGSYPDFAGSGRTLAFTLQDVDWCKELISYWEKSAKVDTAVWMHLVTACARTWATEVQDYAVARIDRPRGAARYSVSEGLTAAWLLRLQSLPCLPDDKFNQAEMPYNLLYRTPETEPLLNIEDFVHRSLDTTQTRKLLELLGVRCQPRSAEKLMQRLRGLAEIVQPPLTHVLDLYRALDGVFNLLDTKGRATIQEQFDASPLILDHEVVWRRRVEIYQANDEELPGVAVIHPEMRALSLWDRLDVERSPNMEKVLTWLRGLPSRAEIAASDRRRVAAILGRTPRVALDATHHWFSRAGTWTPWQEFSFFVVSRIGDGASDGVLFPHVRRQIADFSMLTREQAEALKGHLLPLGEALTYQVEAMQPRQCDVPDWVQAMAVGFLRAKPTDELDAHTSDDAELQDDLQAIDLYYCTFQQAQALRTIPFLDGVQVGTPVTTRALWQDRVLTVVGAEHSYHRDLVEELERRFVLKGFKQVISDCVGRPATWINGYFEERFSLRPLAEAERELGLASTIETATVVPTIRAESDEYHGNRNTHTPEADGAEQPSELFLSLPEITDDEGHGLRHEAQEEQDNEHLTHDVDEEQGIHPLLALRRPTQRHSPLTDYLMSQGFIHDEARRHYSRREDSATVRREIGSEFFIQYNADGEEQAQYWEQTALVSEGVLVPAHIWLYLEKGPAHCSLVMLGLDGKPLVLTAEALLRWKGQQRLTVSAASYRIKFTDEWIASLA